MEMFYTCVSETVQDRVGPCTTHWKWPSAASWWEAVLLLSADSVCVPLQGSRNSSRSSSPSVRMMPPDKTSGRGYFSPDDPTGTEVSLDKSFVWAAAWFLQCVFITLHFMHQRNTKNMTYIIFSLETKENKKISTWIDTCTLPVLLHQSRWTDPNGQMSCFLVAVMLKQEW